MKNDWQIGKMYQMRNGGDVTLMRVNQNGTNPASLIFSDGYLRGVDGRFLDFECPIDIIGELQEQKKETDPLTESLTTAFDKIFGDLINERKPDLKISVIKSSSVGCPEMPPFYVGGAFKSLDKAALTFDDVQNMYIKNKAMRERDNKPDDRRPFKMFRDTSTDLELAIMRLNRHHKYKSGMPGLVRRMWPSIVRARAADKPDSGNDLRPWYERA